MTVADLIEHNRCTAARIAAITSPPRCKCPCAGEFHGLVAAADITTLIDGRRRGLRHLTDLEVLTA